MQALVASYGYVGSASTIYRPTSPGWRLAVHFDDRLTTASDGRGQFAVRVVAEIGAPDSSDSKAVHFTLNKTALRQAGHEWIWLSLEIDVIVPDGMSIDDLRARPRFFGRLRALMEDVLAMLDALPECLSALPGPKLRIEARLLGDLFVCRNGFVSGKGADTDSRYRAACRSACTWVAYILLPEFAAMLHLEDSASLSAPMGRERGFANFSNSGDPRHRNNPVVNRAHTSAEAPAKNTSGKALKPPRVLGEAIAQDDRSLPEHKPVKRSEAKSARDISRNGVTAVVSEIPAPDATQAAEITTIDGVVNSLGSSRRKAGRLAARSRALLHT